MNAVFEINCSGNNGYSGNQGSDGIYYGVSGSDGRSGYAGKMLGQSTLIY